MVLLQSVNQQLSVMQNLLVMLCTINNSKEEKKKVKESVMNAVHQPEFKVVQQKVDQYIQKQMSIIEQTKAKQKENE